MKAQTVSAGALGLVKRLIGTVQHFVDIILFAPVGCRAKAHCQSKHRIALVC